MPAFRNTRIRKISRTAKQLGNDVWKLSMSPTDSGTKVLVIILVSPRFPYSLLMTKVPRTGIQRKFLSESNPRLSQIKNVEEESNAAYSYYFRDSSIVKRQDKAKVPKTGTGNSTRAYYCLANSY